MPGGVAQDFMQEKFLIVGCSQSNIDVIFELCR